MKVKKLEEQQARLIKALLKAKRQNNLLKTKLAVYEMFITSEEKLAADYYIEELEKGSDKR